MAVRLPRVDFLTGQIARLNFDMEYCRVRWKAIDFLLNAR